MEYDLNDLNNDLVSLNFELTPQELAWLKEHYGEELAEKFAKKRKMKKNIWLLMQNNNVLRALIAENKALKKQAVVELKNTGVYKARLFKIKKKEMNSELSF